MISQELQELLDNVYGTAIQRTTALIRKYALLYKLQEIKWERQVDPIFFQHCTRSVNFIVVALYNANKEFLIINSQRRLGPDKVVGWKLPGGPILDGRQEFIEEAVHRIVKRETNLDVYELKPLALTTNIFRWDSASITHTGIAFMGRAIGKMIIRLDVETMLTGTGLEIAQNMVADEKMRVATSTVEFKFTDHIPDEMAFSNGEILTIAQQQLAPRYIEPPHEEVKASRRISIRIARTIHQKIVSKIIYIAASKPVKKRVASYIETPSSVLDSSAGDDLLIYQIARIFSPEICVANDISWSEMERTRKLARKRNLHMIFTNHNAVNMPFEVKFDVVIFKNTLHHARTKEEAVLFLQSIRKFTSKRLIIVDIEDPKRRSLAKIFNKYYTVIHGDQGHYFYSQDQFQKLIKLVYDDIKNIKFDRVHTIRGLYMFAVIDFNS